MHTMFSSCNDLRIERRKIFRNKKDRKNFPDRLGILFRATQTACYGWVLMSNHAHFLVRLGTIPPAKLLHRLLAGYVVNFSLRYKRHGQIFQNRYKSILFQEDGYLKERCAPRVGFAIERGEVIAHDSKYQLMESDGWFIVIVPFFLTSWTPRVPRQ